MQAFKEQKMPLDLGITFFDFLSMWYNHQSEVNNLENIAKKKKKQFGKMNTDKSLENRMQDGGTLWQAKAATVSSLLHLSKEQHQWLLPADCADTVFLLWAELIALLPLHLPALLSRR